MTYAQDDFQIDVHSSWGDYTYPVQQVKNAKVFAARHSAGQGGMTTTVTDRRTGEILGTYYQGHKVKP